MLTPRNPIDSMAETQYTYTRDAEHEHLLVVCNFTEETMDYDVPERFWGSEILISNYSQAVPELRPYEAVMLYYCDETV